MTWLRDLFWRIVWSSLHEGFPHVLGSRQPLDGGCKGLVLLRNNTIFRARRESSQADQMEGGAVAQLHVETGQYPLIQVHFFSVVLIISWPNISDFLQ
jgi:hypothetical protein